MGSINFNGLGYIIHYNPLSGIFTLWLNLLKMTIEIVDFPIENGDFNPL